MQGGLCSAKLLLTCKEYGLMRPKQTRCTCAWTCGLHEEGSHPALSCWAPASVASWAVGHRLALCSLAASGRHPHLHSAWGWATLLMLLQGRSSRQSLGQAEASLSLCKCVHVSS